MVSEKALALGTNRSVIRELFEYGKQRAAAIGDDRVFDFSLGNPSVPPPPIVRQTLAELLAEEDPISLHGYTSAVGDAGVRKAIADSLNRRFDAGVGAEDLYLTAGAAASLSAVLGALCEPGDEILAIAPFFPEYRVFVEHAGGKLVIVPADEENFQIDFDALARLIGPATKALLVNSPNNPAGTVYSEATVRRLVGLLEDKAAEYGKPIFLISDEPYREIVYGDTPILFLTKYYKDTLVCYSYSKSLSLPGERIGYVLVPKQVTESRTVYNAVCGAARALGYVCAPSLFQRLAGRCDGVTSDLSVYARNRDALYSALTGFGFDCVRPDGAFYLFVKAPEADANAFSARAREHELLLVPSDDFGVTGYVRIAYCVAPDMIQRSLPAFAALAREYGL